MPSHLIKVDSEDQLQTGIRKAANVILSGGVVAFPTESFYGLAVNGADEKAIRHLFIIKNRRSDRPVLVLIPSVEDLDRYVTHISETAEQLIKEFWPGGLTLVFEAGPLISPLLTAGSQPACMHAREVLDSMGKDVDLILDGGKTKGGKGSTILDATVIPPVILREGMVSRERLKALLQFSALKIG
jgi:L-threonylcarbamoyladenylate synthase